MTGEKAGWLVSPIVNHPLGKKFKIHKLLMFIDYLKFFFSFFFLFFLPGFSVLYLILRPKLKISPIEYLIFSTGISLALVNLLVLVLNKFEIALNTSNIFNAILLLIALPLVASTFPAWQLFPSRKKNNKQSAKNLLKKLPSYLQLTKNQLLIASTLIFISFFITTNFLARDIVPNNTDLGHHMYWVKLIDKTEQLPAYDTSDVIVGEHIPFAVLTKLTGISVLSAFPVIFLAFISFISLLAIYALALRIFKSQTIAWSVFLFAGVFDAIADPLGKFVSGGVVGNILGNLFIPLILLATYLALVNKKSEVLALAIFLTGSLFYIHHLSAFLLLFILTAFALIYLGINLKHSPKILGSWLKLLLTPLPLIIIGLFITTISWIYLPHYLSNKAVTSVMQSPLKDTHQGVSLSGFISSTGDWRTILGVLGLAIFIFLSIKNKGFKKYSFALLSGWSLILFALSFFPQFFLVDLPSRRVANYLIFPLSITAGYGLIILLNKLKSNLNRQLFLTLLLAIVIALSLNGLGHSLKYFTHENQFGDAVQLYHASQYLDEKTIAEDTILKDHANLKADTWIKFFLLRGYNYILARTFDYKYEDPTKDRETCTRDMIVAPDSSRGKECYQETGTDYLILRKDIDNFFFDLSDNFSKIYSNDTTVIYKKHE
ncbi:MAG: DUF6541 family protein [Patescibacteria group bacterium]|nr:DUF6541 family protein [Patescibacteria group bacterium]